MKLNSDSNAFSNIAFSQFLGPRAKGHEWVKQLKLVFYLLLQVP